MITTAVNMTETAETDKKRFRNLVKEMSKYFFTSSKSASPCSGMEASKHDLDVEYVNIINSYLHNTFKIKSKNDVFYLTDFFNFHLQYNVIPF